MDEQTKRKKLRRYFSKSSLILAFVVLLIALAAAALAGAAGAGEGIAVGLLLAVVGALWLLGAALGKASRPSDQDVDRWLEEDKEQIAKSSLDKLGLDAQQIARTLVLAGPLMWQTDGVPRKDMLWKKGKDGTLRFSVYQVLVIQLTGQILAAYACDFNTLKNKRLNEETSEFYYRDIVSVSTAELDSSSRLRKEKRLTHIRAFRVSMVNGEALEVAISLPKLSESTGGTIPTSDAEYAVRVIRAMLRDKK